MGPQEYGENEEEVFLGRSVARHQNVSEEVARTIDAEVKKIVTNAYERAKKILNEEIDSLHLIAQSLLKYETLTGEEISVLLKEGKINRPDPEEEIQNAGASVPKSGKAKPNLSPGLKPKPQTS